MSSKVCFCSTQRICEIEVNESIKLIRSIELIELKWYLNLGKTGVNQQNISLLMFPTILLL